MESGHQFSPESRERFEAVKPENYKRELRRLGRKTFEAQFLFGFVLFLGAISPLFALAIASMSGGFALFWVILMGVCLVKAFRRIENPIVLMEVRQLILEAKYKAEVADPIADALRETREENK